jgi:hypothetical protein
MTASKGTAPRFAELKGLNDLARPQWCEGDATRELRLAFVCPIRLAQAGDARQMGRCAHDHA